MDIIPSPRFAQHGRDGTQGIIGQGTGKLKVMEKKSGQTIQGELEHLQSVKKNVNKFRKE